MLAQAIARSRREAELASALAEITRLKERLEADNAYLRQSGCPSSGKVLQSRSPRFNQVLEEIAQVAPTNATVLLLGDTGTGKEVLADAIHARSDRRHRPMIKVNCAALPASLIEAELFGREKGGEAKAPASTLEAREREHIRQVLQQTAWRSAALAAPPSASELSQQPSNRA